MNGLDAPELHTSVVRMLRLCKQSLTPKIPNECISRFIKPDTCS